MEEIPKLLFDYLMLFFVLFQGFCSLPLKAMNAFSDKICICMSQNASVVSTQYVSVVSGLA